MAGTGSGSSTQPFGYTGQMGDAETGLLNLRARMYDSETGRFIQRDTFAGRARRPSTLNRFSYVLNNPATYIDPSGFGKDDKDRDGNPIGTIGAQASVSVGALGVYGGVSVSVQFDKDVSASGSGFTGS